MGNPVSGFEGAGDGGDDAGARADADHAEIRDNGGQKRSIISSIR
jgi:hypothetical protein